MKNQAELLTKKPPTRIKTDANILSKKDVSSTSVEPKSKFNQTNQNNEPSIKKKSPYSPHLFFLQRVVSSIIIK